MAAKGRDGATGVKRFVISDAVLVDVDWDGDAALKHRHAQVFMAVLAAAVQSKSRYYEKRLMENYTTKADRGRSNWAIASSRESNTVLEYHFSA